VRPVVSTWQVGSLAHSSSREARRRVVQMQKMAAVSEKEGGNHSCFDISMINNSIEGVGSNTLLLELSLYQRNDESCITEFREVACYVNLTQHPSISKVPADVRSALLSPTARPSSFTRKNLVHALIRDLNDCTCALPLKSQSTFKK